MFDGIPADQLHQLIASRTSFHHYPLSFPALHGSSNSHIAFTAASSDPDCSQQQLPLQPQFLHPLQHQSSHIHEEKEENDNLMNTEMEQHDMSTGEQVNLWSYDEVLALLRIRSTVENCFPDLTWEHVSRKLADLGFKRSAENCKEKFEEESGYLNSTNHSKNYKLFGEHGELYHIESSHLPSTEKNQTGTEEEDNMGQTMQDNSRNEQTEGIPIVETNKCKETSKDRKRKRQQKFKMFQSFCEDVVNKLMAHQEEMHNKLLEDMVKRENEMIAREEAQKKEEMDRINKELEIMAHEQALAGDRHATITEYLKNFIDINSGQLCLHVRNNEDDQTLLAQNSKPKKPHTLSSLDHANSGTLPISQKSVPQNPSTSSHPIGQSPENLAEPTSFSVQKVPKNCRNNDTGEIGKRWPRDEVLALINLRANTSNINEENEGGYKIPIWERISRGMLELGYKRSAKRCKEKWENINKYFRKTKDVSKKRSFDSRTCPYFHQLSILYNQGKIVASSQEPENCSSLPDTYVCSSQGVLGESTVHNVAEVEENVVEAPGFNFEY